MKELSIEQKAKRYDEALERAKDYHKQLLDEDNPEWASEIEKIFPELKESEDEEIRKMLIEFFSMGAKNNSHTNGIADKDIVAWLEKAGEQKSAWSVEDKVMLDEIIDFFENGTVKLQHDLSLYASWLKSLKDRYTWKPSDEQMNIFEHFVKSIGESGYSSPYENNTKLLYSLLEQLKKLSEE